jgi:aryl-phospho-beta-D-glucosidase BglC (GH1 family)
MLRKAGIRVILDLHAAPGVQFANQQYTGKCVFLSDPSFPEWDTDAAM